MHTNATFSTGFSMVPYYMHRPAWTLTCVWARIKTGVPNMALAVHRITQGNNQCCNKEMVDCPGVQDTSLSFSYPQLKCEQGIKCSLGVFCVWRTETEMLSCLRTLSFYRSVYEQSYHSTQTHHFPFVIFASFRQTWFTEEIVMKRSLWGNGCLCSRDGSMPRPEVSAWLRQAK